MMNWYILYCQSLKIEQLCSILNEKKDIHAFIPKMELYRRDRKNLILKIMFPGYLFVLTHRNQKEFYQFLLELGDQKIGFIKELRKDDVSSLTHDEILLFQKLINYQGILKMSYGKRINGISQAIEGPLIYFNDVIKRVDFYRKLAYLDIEFLGREIICGFTVERHAE